MELHLRLRRHPADHDPIVRDAPDRCTSTGPVDVVVAFDAGHRVGELCDALRPALAIGSDAGRVALTSVRTDRRLRPDEVVAHADLISGDELLIGRADAAVGGAVTTSAASAVSGMSGVAVDVVAGPDSGRSHLLGRGRHTIGRRSSADLTLGDRSVSRVHAELVIEPAGRDDWCVSIRPFPDAANGVTVNDVHVDETAVLAPGDVIGLGGTRLAVRTVERSGRERTDRLGRIDFHRTPYRPPRILARTAPPIGPIPERPEPRRFHVFAVLAPLAAGSVMFLLTDQVTFLALTLVSPVVMVATVVEDRRTGRRSFARRLDEFRAELAGRRSEFEQMRHDERLDRWRAHPDLADLARRARERTVDLWSRGRSAPDFLEVRLGLGTSTVRFPIELDRGGDDDLRAEARDAVAGLDTIHDVPVPVGLRDDPILGIHGDPELVDGVAGSLLVQAATLHSPEDLTIVAAVAPERPLDWMKWLPHVRAVTSPLPGDHVVTTRPAAAALVGRLVELTTLRTAERPGTAPIRTWPHVLVVLDGTVGLDPAETSRLLDLAPDAGVSVVWLASGVAGVPRQATRVLDVGLAPGATMFGRLWSTDPDVADHELEVEHVRTRVADAAARALAPVRDASTASSTTSIPRHVPLLDVLGIGRPTADWVIANWVRRTGDELRFPIGVGVDGPVHLDLVADGPHALIGGTSGAGKSELLQSMVAGLAANHSPTRLNFLFVDYKGGASSHAFERLPHTVGHVTNLSAELSLRALTSLRAELDRRMTAMEGRAKDLAEMRERFPSEAPASLVIVVDEFATLVKEVPEFVAGVIDIAQRGRSLGIHLVLATQRPSGSVNEDILANTNLRISLRVLERTESTAIIDSPDAADIPVPLRGRALARLGPRRLVELQSAFGGAPLAATSERRRIGVVPFDRTDASPSSIAIAERPDPADIGEPATHLDAVLDAVIDADATLRLPAPRRPWREVLPGLVTLDRVLTDELVDEHRHGGDRDAAGSGRFVTFGLLDAPEAQAQHPAEVDLEDGGGWLVFGTGGSGKTTLLRTVAASVTTQASDGGVAIVAFDFASRGLTGLRSLPTVVDVALGDDLEAVTRHLLLLDAELERRRRQLADAGAEHLTAFRRDHPDAAADLPRILVLIDGFGGLQGSLLESSGAMAMSTAEEWAERVRRIVTDGRAVGIHTIATADRRRALPSRIHAAIANRLVLRHADEGSYAEHGISADRARHLDLAPGRGLLHGTTLVQVASVSNDATARGQNAALGDVAERCGACAAAARLGGAALPERVTELASASAPYRVALGVADVDGLPVTVDLDWSDLVVCGPPRSGRSNALAAAVCELARSHEIAIVGSAASPLAAVIERLGIDPGRVAFGGAQVVQPVLERFAADLVDARGEASPVLVVDDVDDLDEPALAVVWERLAGTDGLRVVMSTEQRAMSGYSASPMVAAARRARRLLVLQPDDPAEFLQITGVRLPVRPGVRMPPGRGVLLVDRRPTVVQVVDAVGARTRDGV